MCWAQRTLPRRWRPLEVFRNGPFSQGISFAERKPQSSAFHGEGLLKAKSSHTAGLTLRHASATIAKPSSTWKMRHFRDVVPTSEYGEGWQRMITYFSS